MSGSLGRFGHHPDPAIDFCVEVESLEGRLYDASWGINGETVDAVLSSIRDAMTFRVGGDQSAVLAKKILRGLARKAAKAVQP